MGNFDFKFKRGTEVSTHISRFRQILKYTKCLPGVDNVQIFNCKMIIFDSFPKTWKEAFLNKGTINFNECKLVNILQHMDQSAMIVANNDEKNKQDNKNKSDRGWRSNMNKEKRDNGDYDGRSRGQGRGQGGYNHNNNGRRGRVNYNGGRGG